MLFCRNSTFELVVDCMRAGLKKEAGGRGEAPPPPVGGLGVAEEGVAERPRFANVLAFLANKKL